MLDTITGWLTPARRKALYGIVATVTAVLVAVGVITTEAAASYGSLVVAAVEVLALALASIKARRADMTALYAVGAALLTALKVAGIITDGQESHYLDIFGHNVALVPLVVAFVRTDTQTPSGEPVEEYRSRHGAVVGVPED